MRLSGELDRPSVGQGSRNGETSGVLGERRSLGLRLLTELMMLEKVPYDWLGVRRRIDRDEPDSSEVLIRRAFRASISAGDNSRRVEPCQMTAMIVKMIQMNWYPRVDLDAIDQDQSCLRESAHPRDKTQCAYPERAGAAIRPIDWQLIAMPLIAPSRLAGARSQIATSMGLRTVSSGINRCAGNSRERCLANLVRYQ